MRSEDENKIDTLRREILLAADQLDVRFLMEEHLHEDVNKQLWILGLLAARVLSKKNPTNQSRKGKKLIGRPRKQRSDLKPVKLYLQVKMLRDFFEKNEGVSFSQRDAVKLLIKSGDIPENSELAHIEKQVSAGKKCVEEMKKELLLRVNELGIKFPKTNQQKTISNDI